ncbi:unnamed protein product [Brachionus calyciflorus]|uniref:Saposin B-type domain-containing protein n=1 Tax=Brachionus calyciflorus TaxID=104777 RepID=A0A814A4Q0_9BILA|nr:unnamed protein product [Brachionus calyciflorus]
MYKTLVALFIFGFALSSASQFEQKSIIQCEFCLLLVRAAEGLVQQDKTEAQIIEFVEDQLCSKLGALSGICNQYIEAYGKMVIEELVKKAKPEDICKKIGLCNMARSTLPIIELNKILGNDLYCNVCQYAVQFLDNELKNDRTETAIVDALGKVCKVAPVSLRDQCDALVNSYGIYLVQLLIELADPLKVCQAVKLC